MPAFRRLISWCESIGHMIAVFRQANGRDIVGTARNGIDKSKLGGPERCNEPHEIRSAGRRGDISV